MADTRPIFASFSTGEVSPLLYGRVDFAKYHSAAQVLYNMYPRPQGPASSRAGTRFVAEVKDSTKFTRLLPFEFSTEQAYIIEAGDLYFRFYKDGGRIESPPGTPVEVVTPYTSAQLPQVKFAQSADTMYFTHPSHPPYKLTRQSHTAWTMVPIPFLPPITYEAGQRVVTTPTLTLGATTGLGISATFSVAFVLEADIGRMITVEAPSGVGRAIIKAIGGAGPHASATVDIVEDFTTTGPFTTYTLNGSPMAQLTPSATVLHSIITLTLGTPGWRAADVGRYVRVNGGVVKLTKFTSTTVVEGEVVRELNNTTASPAGSWSVEDPTWSSTRGYPRAVTLDDQRLILASSTAQPQSFWGSCVGEYEVFALGPDDDDAFEFTIASNKVNTINWLLPVSNLLMGTASKEFVVAGSPGAETAAITPNSVHVQPGTGWGSSSTVMPVHIGNAVLFATRSGRQFREIVFSVERDAYVANDMTLLAEHLTKKGIGTITDIAYQQHPHSMVWAVRSDGALLSLTYQREHDVAGWGRHITGPDMPETVPVKGKFEAVAVIPQQGADTNDVCWVVVKRTINGASKRFVEYFDGASGFYSDLQTDCALTYSGAPATVLSGLSHLNGETVAILGDGAVYPSAVVSGGQVTLATPVSQAEVGLQFNSMLRTMRPEVPVRGTSQGQVKSWSEIWVRLDASMGLFVNDEEVPFRRADDPTDSPLPLFTGDVSVTKMFSSTDGVLTIERRQPLPLTVVAIFGALAVGE